MAKAKEEKLYPIVKADNERDNEVRGSLRNYYGGYTYERENTDWVPNVPFGCILTYKEYTRGRSAVNFIFVGPRGETYPMFIKDFEQLVLRKHIVNGKVAGMWEFVKRGANYGIRLVDED